MNRSTRGAAFVGLIWVVVLIVLLLIAGVVIYMFASERTDLEQQVVAATREKESESKKSQDALKKLIEVSRVVGYRPDEGGAAMTESNPTEISAMLKQLQDSYGKDGTLGPDASSLSRVVERFRTRIDDLVRERDEARAAAATAEQGRASLQQNLNDVTRQKDDERDQLQKQLQDERDRNASQETADRTRIDDLNKRIADMEGRTKSEKEELEKQVVAASEELKKREGRVAALSKQVEYIRLPDQPDGSVVQVSTTNACFIDLGARDLLRRGTRFKVFTYAKNGEMREKGMIEVTRVEDNMAEATIVSVRDRFDPIARGDKIAAPNYDRDMPREFVLVGRFPSGYSKAVVAERLRALGAKVAEKVGPNTDFLVLGDVDEAAAPAEGEEPAEESEATTEVNDAKKAAAINQVQILPMREILEYLKYD